MTEFLIGIACSIAGYFAQQTAKQKISPNRFFLIMLSIALIFYTAFEMICLFNGTCSSFSIKEIVIELAGSFVLALVCWGLLFCYRRFQKSPSWRQPGNSLAPVCRPTPSAGTGGRNYQQNRAAVAATLVSPLPRLVIVSGAKCAGGFSKGK